MQIVELISVVFSAEGTSPDQNRVAPRRDWKLTGGGVSHGAFQLLSRDQQSLANSFRSATGEPMTRSESEETVIQLLNCDERSMLHSVRKLRDNLNLLKHNSSLYVEIDRSKFAVRLTPGPHRTRLIWLHQVLVKLAQFLPFDDGKAKAFVQYLPETEDGLADEGLFAPNIEWPKDVPALDNPDFAAQQAPVEVEPEVVSESDHQESENADEEEEMSLFM